MSEEKPPEPPSAPCDPFFKNSERKGCVIALLLLGFAGLIVLGALRDVAPYLRDLRDVAPYLFYLAVLPYYMLWPIWLIGGIVIIGVSLGRMTRRDIGDKPPKEDATPAHEDEPEDAE